MRGKPWSVNLNAHDLDGEYHGLFIFDEPDARGEVRVSDDYTCRIFHDGLEWRVSYDGKTDIKLHDGMVFGPKLPPHIA